MSRAEKAILSYILENCLFAYDELCKINKELREGMNSCSNADVDHLGAMNRMIQDYLIIRAGGLFDKTKGVVSFEKLFSNDDDFKKIKEQEIIRYVVEQRNNFVAHTNQDYIENNFPITSEICSSNLKEALLQLKSLIS